MQETKAFERIMKAEKGKSNRRSNIINKRHQESQKLPTTNNCEMRDDSWQVKSNSSDATYLIRRESEKCQYNRFIKCQLCSICIHNFSCSCEDYIQHGTICKHIHLLIRHIGEKYNSSQSKIPCSTFLKTIGDTPKMESKTNIKERILQKLNHVASYIHCSPDIEQILSFEKHYLNPSINYIELHKQQRDLTPANKRMKKQDFFSTKRKCSSKIRLGKPTIEEKKEITAALLSKASLSIPESELG